MFPEDISRLQATDESAPLTDASQPGFASGVTAMNAQDRNCPEFCSDTTFFFERSLDFLCVTGLDGYFKRVNAMFSQVLGYSETELLARPLVEWIHPDDRSATLAEIERLNTGVPTLYFENRYRTISGEYRWIAWTASPQLDQGTLYCIGRDITRQKQTEAERWELEAALHRVNQELEQRVAERTAQLEQANAALRESEERNKLAMEVARMFTFEWEPQTDVVKRSEHCSPILGLTGSAAEQDTGTTFFQRIHPDDRDYFVATVQALTPERNTYKTIYRVIGPDGRMITLEESGRAFFNPAGQLIRLIGMTADVTERKQTEELLHQANERLNVALKSTPITLFNQDRDLSYTWVYNPRHFDSEAMLQKQDVDLVAGPEANVLTQLKQHVLDTGVSVREEVKLTHAEQGFFYDLTIEPLRNAQDEIVGITGAAIDVTDRKQMETQLRLMTEAIPQQIWTALPSGEVDYVNHRWTEYFGVLPAEVQDQGWSSLVHPDDLPSVAEAWAQAVQTGCSYETEARIRCVDGAYRWFLGQAMPLRNEQGQILKWYGTNTEITDRKQAEQRLRESEERLRLGMQVTGFALAKIDYATNTAHLSPEAAQLYGLSTSELVVSREQLHATFHPDDRTELAQSIEQALDPAGTGWFARDHRVIGCDGEVRWLTVRKQVFFDPSGEVRRPLYAILVALDITERKQAEVERQQAEAARRRSEERYRMLFESMADGFCVIEMIFDQHQRPIDYCFLEVNPAFARQTGLQDAEGKTARQLLPDLESHWFEIYGKVALTGESARFESGSEVMQRWFEVHAFRIGPADSHKVAILFKEVSDRKAIEQQREQLLQREQAAREAAEHANRMKDEFLAVLSHELRTPLNPILGWSKLLQKSPSNADKLQQGLATIERNAKQQVQLIEDLLDTSSMIRGKLSLDFKPVMISEPLLAALETIRLAAEAKAIELEVWLNPLVQPIRGDVGRLQQVMWNLLSNAIKFTPTGGRVTVRLTQVDQVVQVQVSDSGKGIAPDFLPHVFELFRQQDSSTTRQFGGLGLGLALARQIVEAHGGTITVTSLGEGRGSTFTIELPLPLQPLSSFQNEPPLTQPRSGLEQLRVVVVDDDLDSLELIQVILEQEGAIVQAVSSAQEALQILTQSPCDVLISDIGMPKMDGYALIQTIRALPDPLNRAIPAIALTAYVGEINQRQALEAGFQAHLPKPIDPQQLLEAIAQLGVS